MEQLTAEPGRVETKTLQNVTPELSPEAESSKLVERLKIDTEGVLLDTDQPIEGTPEAQAELDALVGEHAPLIAGIRTGNESSDDTFLIVDTHSSERYGTPYLLISEAGGHKGIRPDRPVMIGRSSYKDRFSYSQRTSRVHFTVTLDGETGELRVRDNESGNGTYLTGRVIESPSQIDTIEEDEEDSTNIRGVRDEYTKLADDPELIFHDPKDVETAPYGYYKGHPVIGRNSQEVSNGVYGTQSSEWVIVDTKTKPIQDVVNKTMNDLSFRPDDMDARGILDEIRRATEKAMRYDLAETERISRPHYAIRGTLGLSEYVEAGVGVCRQQALLAGVLLESAIANGMIRGSIGIERNIDEDREAGHAWAVLKQEGQPDLIVDPAQHYVGTREEASQKGKWRYAVRGNIG